MADKAMTVHNGGGAIIEQVVVKGDLAALAPMERATYYRHVCDSLGLNPLTQPFAYIRLNGKLTLYARRDAADQLRKLHGVSITISERKRDAELCVVTARATDKDGRTDESTGVVAVKGLGGEKLANALMKAETKAKRRVTLSIVGLGWLDETEVSDISDRTPVTVNVETGEIDGAPTQAPTRTNQQERSTGTQGQDSPPATKPQRPYAADVMPAKMAKMVGMYKPNGNTPHRGACVGALEDLFTEQGQTKEAAAQMRHTLTSYLLGEGKGTSKNWTDAETWALGFWAREQVDDDYIPDVNAMQEATKIIQAVEAAAGQQRMVV